METSKTSTKIAVKQKRLYLILFVGIISLSCLFVFGYGLPEEDTSRPSVISSQFDTISKEVKTEDIRLASLENFNDVLSDRMQSLEKSLLDLREENSLIVREKDGLVNETEDLREKVRTLKEELRAKPVVIESHPAQGLEEMVNQEPLLKIWEAEEKKDEKHVLFEIPAGTVVKGVLVSGADCSVAVQKPTGPNMVLIRPLDNGRLPRKVRVPLKGSIIIGNAIGDISSERVYIRAERMSLVEKNGSFIETEVSAYVSGEDGREGMRGVVVDRSGQIISRAAFAAFLQGIGQTVEATLNNQVIEKLAETTKDQTILNVDMFRTSAIQGGTTALSKLADYYIKRAEQLQPAIQIAAGRIVDVVFTKTVKIGETDLKKKFDREREIKKGLYE